MEKTESKQSFFNTFFRDYKVGAFSSSSNHLIEDALKDVGNELNLIIEQGSGSGVMTKALLNKLSKDGRLILIEQNKEFIEQLKNIQDKRIILFEGSLNDFNYSELLTNNHKADLIISSIPFSFLTKEDRYSVCKNAYDNLKQGGKFVIFHQYSLLMKKVINKYFSNTKVRFVLRNIFPCFIISGLR